MKIPVTLLAIIIRKYPGEILVDEEDYERFKLNKVRKKADGYVEICVEGKYKFLHRVVTEFKWKFVDHKNGIPWDCRKDNLRETTYSQNAHNTGKLITNTSGFKGVYWFARDKKWKACIGFNRKTLHIGYYETPELAHEAYKRKALELFGEFANFG